MHHELFKRKCGQPRPLFIKPCHKDGIEYKGQPSELFGEFLHRIRINNNYFLDRFKELSSRNVVIYALKSGSGMIPLDTDKWTYSKESNSLLV